ncbi:MAG: FG-GAP repeat protein [Methanomicrobia archaeon]|nr:FG-GAP repeat protein [Methanomicrobia archaeon]
MKPIKIFMLLIVLAAMAAGTGMVSGMPFDGFSDVDITDHTGEACFGKAVANAGDLNGDGYTDLVIGTFDGANKAFVYFGGPLFDGTSDVNITDHTGEGNFGESVANAGDLNRDGYADLVIGANTNKAFVYFGGPSFDGLSDVNITDHTDEMGFGESVANAGDLNGDSITDLVIGTGYTNKTFVYFGGSGFDGVDGFSNVTIDDHPTENGFGGSVANAGDLNADGYADLVIGTWGLTRKAFVYFGGPDFDGLSDVNITDHIGEDDFGCSVANAGDLNNDGYADLIIGAWGAAKAFVYFGGPSFDGFSDVNITDHTDEWDLMVYFGVSVANAGDLNNDGYADLVIGTLGHGRSKAYVYYGGPGFDGTSDLSITDHIGAWHFGYAVANAGDLNGDGYTDLVIGGLRGDKKAFVYYGVEYPLKYLPQPTIVTLQGKLTDTAGNPIQTGSLKVTINDTLGNPVWQSIFDDCLFDGVFNIPLGAVQELRLIPGNMYQMVIEIDVDSATFAAADVTFGDNVPAGDVIKFTA